MHHVCWAPRNSAQAIKSQQKQKQKQQRKDERARRRTQQDGDDDDEEAVDPDAYDFKANFVDLA